MSVILSMTMINLVTVEDKSLGVTGPGAGDHSARLAACGGHLVTSTPVPIPT